MSIKIEVGAAIDDFRWNQAEYTRLIQGPVVRDLVKRAIRVENAAKRNATGRPGPNVITGLLRGSITWRIGNDAISPYVDVGSAVVYAPYVELGTSVAPPYPFLGPALEAARE